MLLLILSWIYILITTVHLGYGTANYFKLNIKNFILINVLGLFSATVIGTIWAFFGRINIEFHLFLLALNLPLFLARIKRPKFEFKTLSNRN
jgi:hypothetical protein